MARRGRDLFEMLRERGGGRSSTSAKPSSSPKQGSPGRSSSSSKAGSSGKASAPASARAEQRADSGPGLLARLRATARALVANPASTAAAERTQPRVRISAPAGLDQPVHGRGSGAGMGLVAVAAVALLAGFVLGRLSAGPGTGAEAALRTTAGTVGNRPGWVPTGVPGSPTGAPGKPAPTLSAEQEEASLSNLAYPLLQCPALERARAAAAAAWLRDQGIPNARIRPVEDLSGNPWFLVLCYTTPQDQARDLERLRSLELTTEFDARSAAQNGTVSSMRSGLASNPTPLDLTKLKKKRP